MIGRPSGFSQEIADRICTRLVDGESLRAICREEDMPGASTVFQWLRAHPSFADQYAHAREMQADLQFDEVVEISDDGSNDWMERKNSKGEMIGWQENGEAIRRSVLRVDTRKWRMSKLAPKKYGERVDVNHGVQDSLGEFLAALDGKNRGIPGR